MIMLISLAGFLQQLRYSASQAVSLLAPNTTECTICHSSFNQADNSSYSALGLSKLLLASICGDCLSSIPWMTRIKCPVCGRGTHCEDCKRNSQCYFIWNRSAVAYSSLMREWLARYKYRGDERVAPILAEMLIWTFERMTTERFVNGIYPQKLASRHLSLHWDGITYVPISLERAAERGFNQAEQLAENLADRYKLPIYRLLTRSRHTEKMSFKSRSERMRSASSLFEIDKNQLNHLLLTIQSNKRNEKLKGVPLRLLLIDDIYTTGSTANACCQIIKQHIDEPVELYVLTWARS